MLTLEDIQEVVFDIDYKEGYGIRIGEDEGRFYIQVITSRPCSITGRIGEGRGGKRFLSKYMCKSEIVLQVLGAFLAYEEHEAREWFRYKHVQIFSPHLDPDKLAEFVEKEQPFQMRNNFLLDSPAQGS